MGRLMFNRLLRFIAAPVIMESTLPPTHGIKMSSPLNLLPYLSSLALRRRWLMLAMLLPLHLAVLLGIDDPWTRALLIFHLGIFLLWQPMWRGEREISTGILMLIGVACTSVVLWLNWWLIAFWLGVLFALVGGRVFSFRATWLRWFYLAAMFYLLALLLLWVTPHLFAPNMITPTLRSLMQYAPPLILLGMAIMPVENESIGTSQAVDFLYSTMLFLLMVALVLSSFTYMTLGKTDYLEALLRALFSLAALLLTLGWLWNPRFGFSGLRHLFSGYLLNVGTPLDQWLTDLAQAAEMEHDATGFLEVAARQLAALPWIKGVAWQSPNGDGKLGEDSSNPLQLETGQLHFELAASYRISPSLLLHTRLLVQIIGRFYEAKRREHTLRQMTRLQAIYETGSRLTHDIKNLLQSLYSLTSAGQQAAQTGQTVDFQKMLNNQLPELSQRLEQTLNKLKVPQKESSGEYVVAAVWWKALRNRYDGRSVEFIGNLISAQPVPSAVFENVAENLLDNARRKRLTQANINITVRFSAGDSVTLTVCDDGEPVPEKIVAKLFQNTVSSETGLGIGLYQAYRWAEQHGYALCLKSNERGAVCFELAQGNVGARHASPVSV